MSTIVTARIDVSTPSGRRVVRELENKKYVKLEHELPAEFEEKECYTHEFVFGELRKKIKEHYGVR